MNPWSGSSSAPLASDAQSAGNQSGLHLAFVATCLLWLIAYLPTYLSLVETWSRTGTFQFAFLIFPICAVLVWGRRHWLARVYAEPAPHGLWAALALAMLWLVGAVADINLFQHIAAVTIWPVWIYVFYGWPVARILAFPMGYVLFAIPFGNFMVVPLQTITAHLSVAVLHLTDVPVLMEGHFIDTPAAKWHVAEACSGVKFFVATTAFGVLYAHLFFTSLTRRLIFVASSMIVPIIANGLRVFFTILIGEHFGIEYASGTDHAIFGWQFFGTVLVLLFFAGWPFHQPPARPPAATSSARCARRSDIMRLALFAAAIVVVPAVLGSTLGSVDVAANAAPGLDGHGEG
ncbi:exosortase A [Salinisphaera sp. T31B1]|uniref:exosortase A n=1 Tax=Salinisphaera sp. T31B1 TaxID=727963 RepID=UPI003340EA95